MDTLFAPPDEQWQRLAPEYATVRRLGTVVASALLGGVAVVSVGLLVGWNWALIPAALTLSWAVWRFVRVGRWVASWGYAERDEDLFITHGLWFKELISVPYGRMQGVKVEAGPIERRFGLSRVSLITASPHTDAVIPGLTEVEAVRLRDRLIERGQALEAGL